MQTPLRWITAFLFPACAAGLLVGGSSFSRKLDSSPGIMAQIAQQQPALANPSRLIILHHQYRFYQRFRHSPVLARRSALFYNQCVADSDPSVLRGTNLPPHLP